MKTRKGQAIPIIAVGILVAGSIAAFTILSPLSTTSNLCTTSMDEVFIKSNVLEFSGDKGWSIEASTGCDNKIFGGGGTIPKEEFSSGEIQATSDFTIAMTDFKAWFYHNVKDRNHNTVYDVREKEITCKAFTGCGDDAYQKCQDFQAGAPSSTTLDQPSTRSEVDDYTEGVSGSSNDILHCFRGEAAGVVGEFEGTEYSDFKGRIQASANGRTDAETISKTDTVAELDVGDVNNDGDREHAQITWLGSLLGKLRGFSFEEDYRPVCSNRDQNCQLPTNDISWQTTEEEDFNSYADKILNFEDCTKGAQNQKRTECVTEYKSALDQVLTTDNGRVLNDAGSWADSLESKNGQVRVVAKDGNEVERPDFRFLIDADWVGTTVPVGKPNFKSVPSEVNLRATESSTFQVQVKNTASSGTHRIEVNSDCPSPLSDDRETRSIEAGDTVTYQLDISSGPSETNDYSCTLTAQDTDSASTSVTETMTVSVTTNCQDSDGDGVCDRFDKCDGEKGTASNNGCKEKEICGNGIDDDGDGRVDENCGGDGGSGGNLLNFDLGSFGEFITNPIKGIKNSIDSSLNKFGTILGTFDIIISLIVGIVAFGFSASTLSDFIAPTLAKAGAPESGTRLVMGVLGFLLGSYFAFITISSIVVKILLLILLIAGAYIYIQIQAVMP